MNVYLISLIITLVKFSLCRAENFDPCCSFPCQNRGVCLSKSDGSYTCDCYGQPYYGENCEIPTLGQRLYLFIKPSPETLNWLLTNHKWFWSIIQNISFIKSYVTRSFLMVRQGWVDSPPLYAADEHDYTTLDAAKNLSYFARILPHVPKNCPTPMGVFGPKELPPIEEVVDKLFKRREFIPNKIGSSLLLAYTAQHFVHQFFKTDFDKGPGYTWGGSEIDLSHIYGNDKHTTNMLRSGKDGKMKMQIINGEEYPPYLKDAPVRMDYPTHVPIPDNHKFALGHRFYALLPGLFLWQVIMLREHNRICDVLKKEYTHWDDERLFQTAKLVLLGVQLKVILEYYVQGVSNYHLQIEFDPTLLHGELFQYQNRAFLEYNHLYHWHQLMPDEFDIGSSHYTMEEYLYHSDLVIKHGTRNFTDAMCKQIAGQIGLRNNGPSTQNVAAMVLKHARELRFQPFNQYRKRFGIKPFESFEELTGDKEHAEILKDLYGEIDAVEFYTGLIAEKRRSEGMFGLTMFELAGAFSLKGIFSTPICTPEYWKPSTFGGKVGFNIVNSATLRSLFCGNIPGDCPYVSMRVPGDNPEDNLPKTEL